MIVVGFCGSTQHRKVDCPVRGGAKQSSPTKPTSETNAGSGGGKGKGGGKKSDGSASTGNTSNAGAKTSSTSIPENKNAGSQPEKDPQQKNDFRNHSKGWEVQRRSGNVCCQNGG